MFRSSLKKNVNLQVLKKIDPFRSPQILITSSIRAPETPAVKTEESEIDLTFPLTPAGKTEESEIDLTFPLPPVGKTEESEIDLTFPINSSRENR